MATTKNYATFEDVAQLTAKIDDVVTALASLAAAQAGGKAAKADAPKAPKAPAKAPKAPAKVDGLQVKLIGNPDRVYIERAWAWAEWDTKPTPATLKRLKAAGWKYSGKRRAWHKVNHN